MQFNKIDKDLPKPVLDNTLIFPTNTTMEQDQSMNLNKTSAAVPLFNSIPSKSAKERILKFKKEITKLNVSLRNIFNNHFKRVD